MKEKMKVAVLFGGQSNEHEVSRVSAKAVIENLNPEKYEVVAIGISKDGKWSLCDDTGENPREKIQCPSNHFEENHMKENCVPDIKHSKTIETYINGLGKEENIDVVFPVLHGCNGEDGSMQGLLELAGIPYVGCGILASAVGMDKAISKIIFKHAKIPQGKYMVVLRPDMDKNILQIQKNVEESIGYPCFVKPSNAGSSVGVSKVGKPSELLPSLVHAGKYDRKILIEEFIDGREVECAVLGNESPVASTVGEVVPCNEFYDYQAKYIDGDSKIIIPAELDDATIQIIRNYAVTAFKELDCSGLARVDFFVEKRTGKVYINEINTMPGFTDISMYPKLWEACGVSYPQLLDRLIELAFLRYKENRKSCEREM